MLYENGKLLLVAGPSLLENERTVFSVAEVLKRLAQKYAATLKVVFRSSFDKPHRSGLLSARGEGMDAGLTLLTAVKDQFDLPVATDVHQPHQINSLSLVCDMLQIPSQLCRSTDLATEAARSGCTLNLRKGTSLSPQDTLQLVEKIKCANPSELWVTERGTAFGYNNLVVDMRVFPVIKKTECPVLIDATVVSQMTGLSMPKASELPDLALAMARASLAAGADGLYLDVHPEPENALVDNMSHLPLEKMESFVDECLQLWVQLSGK